MSPIDVNRASAEELLDLPGIGEKLAARIIEHRASRGPFRSLDELATVNGISERMVLGFGARASVASSLSTSPSFTMIVTLTPPAGVETSDYGGYSVALGFVEIVSGRDTTAIEVPRQVSDRLECEGEAQLQLPALSRIKDDTVQLQVSAPDGELLLSENIGKAGIATNIEREVPPRDVFGTAPTDDPRFGRPTKLRGRVVDAAGKSRVAGRQVIIWVATVESPTEGDFRAMGVGLTDGQGYFSTPYAAGPFSEARGAIALPGADPAIAYIALEAGELPEHVILVVDDLSEEVRAELDKTCPRDSALVPRAPDGADLTATDGTFSDDLGGGRCVDFTKPSRTLDEFSFSYAVRTTEPEIRGFTLEDAPTVAGDLILKLAPHLLRDAGFVLTSTGEGGTTPVIPLRAHDSERGTSMQRFVASEHLAWMEEEFQALEGASLDARIVRGLAKDPDGFSLTQLFTANRRSSHQEVLDLLDRTRAVQPGRRRMTCDQPVDWDDEPTIYQACTIAHGHLLRFKQEWVADGYSLGDLLYSLPLAPGQKKQVAIVDWERREESRRDESVEARERLTNVLSRDRDINEMVNTTLRESIRGGSTASTSAFGGGIGIGAILGPVGGLLGIGGGASKASSRAWQDSSRDLAAGSLQQLRDRTSQAAAAVRSQRATVVQATRQGEQVRVETESVANYNHCHAMTIQYFEVLRHLIVRQRLADVQECLFVPLLMTRFDQEKVRRWRGALESVAPLPLRGGFAAVERVATDWRDADVPDGRWADEAIQHLDGDLRIRFRLVRPRDEQDEFFEEAWTPLVRLFGFTSAAEFHRRYIRDRSEKDRIFLDRLGPDIASAFVDRLRFYAHGATLSGGQELPIDATLVSNFVNGRDLVVTLNLRGEISPSIKRSQIERLRVAVKTASDDESAADYLPDGSQVLVSSGRMSYRLEHFSHDLFRRSQIRDDLLEGDDVYIHTPLGRREERNPRNEDRERARELLQHLNENIERYHHSIWWQMGDDRRYMLLDGFIAPNSGCRSVASVVENELIGIVGNCLILPVAHGYNLDPTYRVGQRPGEFEDGAEGDFEGEVIDLLEHYQPTTPIDPIRVSVPTKGVYAEAVNGQCNSCERKEEDRFWRWEESPIPDSPTQILPVDTASRQSDTPDLTPSPLPAPIINLQNAPTAPDPTGLAAALQILGQGDLFRDFTGLNQNQLNALGALQSALQTAQFFGGEASKLAVQAHMGRNLKRALDHIKEAKDAKLITDEQAQELAGNAITGALGGGGTNPVNANQRTMNSALDTISRLEAAGSIPSDRAKALREEAVKSFLSGSTKSDSGAKEKNAGELIEKGGEAIRKSGIGSLSVETTADDGARTRVELVSTAGGSFNQGVVTRCGFFGPGTMVDVADLRDSIRSLVQDERLQWFDAAGNAQGEGTNGQFGHLVRYWLASEGTIRPTTLSVAQARAIGGAVNYGQLLDPNPPLATINSEAARVRQDLLNGAPDTDGPTNLNTLVETAIIRARLSRIDLEPWSAVFVVACVREAARSLGLEAMSGGSHRGLDGLLRAHRGHRFYVEEAYERRFGPVAQDGTYHAFHVAEHSVSVGDIITQDRQATAIGQVMGFEDIPGVSSRGRELHCDIVVEIGQDYAETIGGNLSNGVRRRRFPLDANGRLVVAREQLYVQENNAGVLPVLPAVNPAAGLDTSSTGRIFAVLSLVESCAMVPGSSVGGGLIV